MAGFFKSLFNKITNRAEIEWDDLEADLIAADLGIALTTRILDELRALKDFAPLHLPAAVRREGEVA